MEDPLSENLLSGEFNPGDLITVTRAEGKEHLSFKATRPEPTPPPPAPAGTAG